jgi:pSer/pThr/pTyr-binding forkhead associated (FHA) protein
MNLVCLEGKGKGHVWELTGGRSLLGGDLHCDIVIKGPRLSRLHAAIICDEEALVFVDRESQSVSYIHSVRVTSHPLLPGDVIRLGCATLKAVEEGLSQEVC